MLDTVLYHNNFSAQLFKKTFSPYLKSHIKKNNDPDLYGGISWYTVQRPLTDNMINKSILGFYRLGYMLSFTPSCISFDIDDHENFGYEKLMSKYKAAVTIMGGVVPSVLERTNRGLHAFWLLTDCVPFTVLSNILKPKLNKIGVELQPTPATGLSIPQQKMFINPETMGPILGTFEEIIKQATRYHPVDVLGLSILPAALRQGIKQGPETTPQERREQVRNLTKTARISKIELNIYPIRPGQTNEALNKLIPVYRAAGLTEAQAGERFTLMLSTDYAGEMRNTRRLMQRIKSFYRHSKESPYIAAHSFESENLFRDMVANNLALLIYPGETKSKRYLTRHTRTGQKQETIKRLIKGLIDWKDYIDRIKASPANLSAWAYIYKYFRKGTREGFYPIPQGLLKRIDNHYHRNWNNLIRIGFIQRSPYGYSVDEGICLYYRINETAFLSQ